MKINSVTKGSGEIILILHGWGASAQSWIMIQDSLANQNYKVVAPDLPGFGESQVPAKPWNSDNYSSWLIDFIKSEQLTTPLYLVGHSFGGSLAAKLAIEHPDLIKKLILVAAARTGQGRTSLKVRLIKAGAELGHLIPWIPFSKVIRKAFYKFVVRSRDYEKAHGVMRETMKLVLKEDLTSRLSNIKTPTLIIWGDQDKATPIDNAYIIDREIKNSRLEIIPGGRHAINLTHPEEISRLIADFVRS